MRSRTSGRSVPRPLLVAPAGKYFTACKPGMVGDGIRADFTVTDSGDSLRPSGDDKELVDQANTNYAGPSPRPELALQESRL